MAPKRNREVLKKVCRSKRCKPVLPDVPLNTSMSIEEQENKMNDYIEDFLLQVKSKREKMIKCIQKAKALIGNAYKSATIEIVKSVRKMTFEEFLNKGGNVDLAISAQVTASITELASASTSVTGNMPVEKRMPLSNLSSEINSSGFVLDQSTMENGFSSNVQTVGKSNRSRKRNTAITSPRRTRSSRRLQGKMSATPALNFITPIPKSTTLTALTKDILITPKFDPRLPIPATRMRAPIPGERVISMTGSPLTNYVGPSNHNAPKVIIPLTGGKTLQLSVDENSSLSAQDIDVASDNVAQNNIRLLQEKLSKMLKMPK